jgi:glycosyltransferase involved in cell wall biosynthesis
MVVHSYCPADPRVRREAEALAEAGWGVDVICLRDHGQSLVETIGGVRYVRFPLKRRRGGMLRYVFEYAALLAVGTLAAVSMHGVRRYKVVQAHNMPDFLVFCGLVPWLTGVPVLLDLHDPIPELYMSKFGLAPDSRLIRLLERIEGMSVRFADHALAATGAFRQRLVERGRPPEKITVLLNSPDPRLFRPRSRNGDAPRRPRLLFHGTVTHRSGVDCAVRAAERVRAEGVDLELVVVGDGDFLPEVRRLAGENGRSEWLDVRGPVPLERVPEEIALCDVGIVPNRGGPFTDLALPTRLFEYLSMDRPVIVSHSPAIADLFDGNDLLFFESGNEEDLARVIGEALRDPARREACVQAGGRVAAAHRWDREREVYLSVVESLADGGRPSAR